MPTWKKVVVSGSAASLNSLNVATNVVAQSFTGSLFGTSSYASQALSSSFAISSSRAVSSSFATTSSYTFTALSSSFASTASYVNPLRQDVIITGSLSVSSSIMQYSDNTDVDTGTETVMTIGTGSYRSAFFDYVITKTTNARSGTVMAVWNAANIQFTETSTNDIGTTSDLILTPVLSGANVLLQARALSDNWSVKTLARLI